MFHLTSNLNICLRKIHKYRTESYDEADLQLTYQYTWEVT